MLWGVALLFTALSLTVVRRCLAQPFDMPFWSLSFPLAASAALSLHMAGDQAWAQPVALAWLVVVTLVISALLFATLWGLLRGRLLVPEVPERP
jgi:tellurite resistance protein